MKCISDSTNTWWYGFKEAEQIFMEGYVPDYNDFTSNYVWFVKGACQLGVPLKYSERVGGVLDYISYREDVLRKLK
jgi:hypothetical protein